MPGEARVCCLILVIVLSASVYAQENYVWPLTKNYGISATFGESRSDHFHAGIDISTNGETGLPVFAVADGAVHRIKITKRGYGRALYIRHSDGTESVYAHLESYSTELGLEQLYQDRVKQSGTRYVGDVFPEPPVSVKRGDVVAYSGESGAGLPHLHMEIRKNDTVAVNPLINGFQDTLDPIPPTFQALYFYPLTGDSAVNGDPGTREFRLKKKEQAFVTDALPVVRGEFMISVSVYDSALRPYHRAPFRIHYSIDDKVLFVLEFDKFSYSEPGGFGLTYDLGKPGPSYYEYPVILRKLIDLPQPFISRWIPFSTKSLSPGLHRLKIEAGDTNLNTSTATIDFLVNDPPEIVVEDVSAGPNDVAVTAVLSDPDWKQNAAKSLSGEVEYSTDGGKTFDAFPSTALVFPTSSDLYRFHYRVPNSLLAGRKKMLIKARACDGTEYSAYSIRSVKLTPAVTLEQPETAPAGVLRFETFLNAIKIIFETEEPFAGTLSASAGDPPSLFALNARELTSRTALIAAPKQTAPISISLPGGQSLSVPVDYLVAGNTQDVSYQNFRISFKENSLYWDSFIWSKSIPAYSSRSLPPIGPILQLGPRGLPLKKNAVLQFHYPSAFAYPEKLSIYHWDRAKQKWESLPSQLDRTAKSVQTKISFLDLYALIYDNVPPTISHIFPGKHSVTRNNTPLLAAIIRDSGMDVDDEKITFYVDGIAHAADYDPDRNVATTKIEKPLKKGTHRFSIVVYDYAGNKTQSRSISFRIK